MAWTLDDYMYNARESLDRARDALKKAKKNPKLKNAYLSEMHGELNLAEDLIRKAQHKARRGLRKGKRKNSISADDILE